MSAIFSNKINFKGLVKIYNGDIEEGPPPEAPEFAVQWNTPEGQVAEGYSGDAIDFQFDAELVEV